MASAIRMKPASIPTTSTTSAPNSTTIGTSTTVIAPVGPLTVEVAAAEYGSEGERHESDGATDEEISAGSSLCCDMLLGSIPSASNVLLRPTC